MVSAEVQRTLVKSPPELWSELSDPASLARHLGELGEIRITRADAEKELAWEAEEASGTVAIKPSGWGTRVTLTMRRHAPEPPVEEPGTDEPGAEEVAAQPLEEPGAEEVVGPRAGATAQAPAALDEGDAIEAIDDAQAEEVYEAMAEPAAGEPPLEQQSDPEMDVPALPDEEQSTDELDSGAATSALPEPRRPGFWSRLFGRWRRPELASAHDEAEAGELARDIDDGSAQHSWIRLPRPATAAAQAAHHGSEEAPASDVSETEIEIEPPQRAAGDAPPPPEPGQPAAAVEEGEDPAARAAVEEATALLSAVLDRLGAAHHRPFSRP